MNTQNEFQGEQGKENSRADITREEDEAQKSGDSKAARKCYDVFYECFRTRT